MDRHATRQAASKLRKEVDAVAHKRCRAEAVADTQARKAERRQRSERKAAERQAVGRAPAWGAQAQGRKDGSARPRDYANRKAIRKRSRVAADAARTVHISGGRGKGGGKGGGKGSGVGKARGCDSGSPARG